MKKHPFKPELLAPAGNFEKLEIAVHYGADAVYLAGKDFSLRNFSGNFTDAELLDAVAFARQHKVKVYLACNIYSRNNEHDDLKTFLNKVGRMGPDAIIISDPGIIMLAKKIIPQIEIHLSTQANTTNLNAANFWHSLGIKRVNLARELSLTEIKEIARNSKIETEIFIHGAMCVSYSGRCLLSNFLSGRDSNRGLCSHPCRWKYSVVEELRPNVYHSLMEDDQGSYIFNSKDLCMIDHIPELIDANITSLKIEGRMKGINYLASVVKTYREAIDTYVDDPDTYEMNPEWSAELYQVFHREYCTGFYFNKPDEQLSNYNNIHQGKIHSFIGKIISCTENKEYMIGIRNKLSVGDTIEVLSPKSRPKRIKIIELFDMNKNPIDSAQPNTIAILKLMIQCQPNDIVRKI
ncbi:MAG: U32 family peptidase [Proteobacteria bacterium]|nr:U32 family peptidase [Pseudomonadota bacterium]MBU1585663.1 U32 family peptidase [Pseudomonadota bacterium]MBU2453888.1 U32 family peptidase [Pseudomonadota bacterium]MBU2628903.1 U32 family peptidase [Pseudomonadota bacterium]